MNEPESHSEQLSRAEMMADGSATWDLSKNDRAALKTVLDDRDDLLSACKALVGYFASDDDYRAAVAEAKAAVEKAEGK